MSDTRNPDVVVIMSLYKNDSCEYFNRAVDSILNQSIDCDLIIFRDGLVSNVLELSLKKLEKNSKISVLRSPKNIGLAHALNNMIDYCSDLSYKFIARMDSDDISHPERLKEQVDYLTSHNDVSVVGTFCKEFGSSFALDIKELPTAHDDLLDFSISRCPFIHPTVMFRTEVFRTSSARYPTDTSLTEDMGLWFKLLEKGFKFSNIPKPLLLYRLDESTVDRRKGIGKAISEFQLRYYYMRKLNCISLRNCALVFSRLVFHLLPSFIVKFMYKNYR
ncbi:TPA: glycosyltransferase [Vibrio harveyi]|nr:glycosyltransferase [Vibrio harveyi]HDM8180695.1 glycosyltransferase [Vibrio harveyi]